jgi:hypothetical protein
MTEEANELARKGRYRESIEVAAAAMGAEWTRKRATPTGAMTISDVIDFLQALLRRIDAMRKGDDPDSWTAILPERVVEELIAKIAIVESPDPDWVDGPKDVDAVAKEDQERYRKAAKDVTQILETLDRGDARIEDVMPLLKGASDVDTVEQLLNSCAPGRPTLIGETGPLLDLNVKKPMRFLVSRSVHTLVFEVEDANERTRTATIRIHVDTATDVHALLHGTKEPLEMDFSSCDLAWEHCFLAQAAKMPLSGNSSMTCALSRADAAKSTLRLQTVQFAREPSIEDIKSRVDRRLWSKIGPALKRIESTLT